jgi:uncharacterized protein YkwD
MITTLVLCASLILPLADEQTLEKKDAQTVEKKNEQSVKKDSQTTEKKDEQTAEKKADDPDLLAIEANVVSYTNNERARYGLPPLQVSKNLMDSARNHCSWMTLTRNFTHSHQAVAENIAMGQPSSLDVVRTWMNSSGHRANILNPYHRFIGVGVYRTEGGTIYWCQQFSQ